MANHIHSNLNSQIYAQTQNMKLQRGINVEQICREHGLSFYLACKPGDTKPWYTIGTATERKNCPIQISGHSNNVRWEAELIRNKIWCVPVLVAVNRADEDDEYTKEIFNHFLKQLPQPVELNLEERVVSLDIRYAGLDDDGIDIDEIWCLEKDAELIIEKMIASAAKFTTMEK